MIYKEAGEYKTIFYKDQGGSKSSVFEYISKLERKESFKIFKYIEFLRLNKGVLDEPYSKHIKGKIRELRVDFAKNRYRIFYFAFIGKHIIVLHAFLKKTEKTPLGEIKKAEAAYQSIINNPKLYV